MVVDHNLPARNEVYVMNGSNDAKTHFYAALREGMLALRSLLDSWIGWIDTADAKRKAEAEAKPEGTPSQQPLNGSATAESM